MDEGGFWPGMDEDAKSRQLATVTTKRCPSCRERIEKNAGCLHMTCPCGLLNIGVLCWVDIRLVFLFLTGNPLRKLHPRQRTSFAGAV